MPKTSQKNTTAIAKYLMAPALVLAALVCAAPAFSQSTPAPSSKPQTRETPAPEASPAESGAPLPVALNSCATVRVATVDPLDSATARAGDIFRFKTLDPIDLGTGGALAPQAMGLGVVSLAQHADRGGKGGFLALDPRYIKLEDGRQIQVLIDRAAPSLSGTGSSANIPGYAGIIPGIGIALSAYAFIHHGKDITIPAGHAFRVFAGELETVSKCRADK